MGTKLDQPEQLIWAGWRFSPVQAAVCVGVLVLGLQVGFWFFCIRRYYFPVGDDFALIVHSTRFFHQSPANWFLEGFSKYFNPYPDLSLRYSEFLRPVDNAVYYANSLLFGKNWPAYLLMNYAIAATVVATTLLLCLRALRLTLITSALVALSAAVSPAYGPQFVYRPSFAFDYLAAAWILLLIACLTQRRLAAAWVLLCLATFTKESAYYASIATSMVILLQHSGGSRFGRLIKSSCFLLPITALGVLRTMDFRSATGVYVLNGLSLGSEARNVVLGLTRWPYIVPGEQHIREFSLHNIGSLVLSLALWAILLRAGFVFVRMCAGLRNSESAGAELVRSLKRSARVTVLIFFAFSLGMPLLLDQTARFGASEFPLLFMTLGVVMEQRSSSKAARFAPACILAVITLLDIAQLGRVVSKSMLTQERASWAFSKSLVTYLGKNASTVSFLVDDVSEGFSSPESMQLFAGYQGQVVPVSSLATACASGAEIKATGWRVTSIVKPECGTNILYGAFRLSRVSGTHLERNLPSAKITYDAKDRPVDKAEFISNELSMRIEPRVPGSVVLIPDFRTLSYREILPEGGLSPAITSAPR